MSDEYTVKFHQSIRGKLLIVTLLIVVLAVGITAGMAIWKSSSALTNNTQESLQTMRDTQKKRIEDNFMRRVRDTELFAQRGTTTDRIIEFSQIFNQYGPSSPQYRDIERRQGPGIERFREGYQYLNFYLVSKEGTIVYQSIKQPDFGTNLMNGPYSNSNLAACFKESLSSPYIVDFDNYDPSKTDQGNLASFVGAPVKNSDGAVIGVVIGQISSQRLSDLMRDADMGETGEAFMVGAENFMLRNTTRGGTAFMDPNRRIDTEAAQLAARGQTGITNYVTDKGDLAIAAYCPLNLPEGLHWVLVLRVAESEALAAVSQFKWTISVITVIILVVAFVASLMLANNIANGIKMVVTVMTEMVNEIARGRGDLTRRIDSHAKDETGILARGFNSFVDTVENIVANVKDSAIQLAASSEQIATSAQNVSQGAQSQASTLEEVAASIEELTSSIQNVAQSSQDAVGIATEATREANEGGKAVTEANESINKINQSAQQIADITNVIGGIADQTNLLALNAAIEAARAGEHGMGFAVVADEVRKLAERAAGAAQEITTLIKESVTLVQEGVERGERTGGAIKKILESVDNTARNIESISASTEEQNATAQEVARAIENVSSITEENSGAAEEMSAAAEELAGQADGLRQMVDPFKVSGTKLTTQKKPVKNQKQATEE